MENACPKCGTVASVDVDACARCGLAVSRFGTFDATPPPHPVLDAAFAALDERWHEPAAHDAFLQLAGSLDALDAAAARYQARLRRQPGDRAAERALSQVVLLVTHRHAAGRNDTARLTRGVYYVGVVVGIALFASVTVLLVHVLRR